MILVALLEEDEPATNPLIDWDFLKLYLMTFFIIAIGAVSYTSVFAKALVAEAKADPRIVAVSAAMPSGTGVDIWSRWAVYRFPGHHQRFICTVRG